MSKNLLDQLAEVEIPSPPEDLDRQIHDRLNSRLLFGQFGDFALRGLPYAFFHLTQAMIALIRISLIGDYEEPQKKD